MGNADDIKKELLKGSHTIAVVGLTPDRAKASNIVANYLIANGFRVIPVNPRHTEILGRKCYPSVSHIPEKVDIVDIFLRSEKVLPVVERAIKLKPKAIWLQLGIINNEAQELVENNNILFFMNQCIKQEHDRLFNT